MILLLFEHYNTWHPTPFNVRVTHFIMVIFCKFAETMHES